MTTIEVASYSLVKLVKSLRRLERFITNDQLKQRVMQVAEYLSTRYQNPERICNDKVLNELVQPLITALQAVGLRDYCQPLIDVASAINSGRGVVL